MSTGAPIYLVSACVSGEEFVAAFRRYADRNGLFVPMAEPLPTGRKGRFALTLRDGGVMVEGEAEIVSAAKTPSPVHGRVGMTLKFVEPDELSKTVLVELEKARLAMKPAAPSVPPRPAEIPAEPRPVPPPVAGRIDANNALAECVAIGDVASLAVVEAAPAKPGPKFVVPSIPAVGSRPHTPSTPPVLRPHTPSTPPVSRPSTPTTPPSVPPIPARPKAPTDAPIPSLGKASGSHTALPATMPAATAPTSTMAVATAPTSTMPVATAPPTNPTPTIPTIVPSTKSTQPTAVVPPPAKPSAEPPPLGTSDTMLAMRAPAELRSKITRTQPAAVAPPPAPSKRDDDDDEPIEPPAPSPPREAELVPVPQTDTIFASSTAPSAGRPRELRTIDVESNLALISGDTAEIAAVVPPPADEATQTNFVLPMRPPAKPAAKNGVAAEPSASVVAPPILPAGARSFVTAEDVEIAEPTELSEIDPDIAASSRRTTIGVAVVPEGVTVLPAKTPPSDDETRDTSVMEAARDTSLMEAQQPTAGVVGPRTVDGHAPTVPPVSGPFEVQEPTPSGDWTIQTAAGISVIEPVKRGREPKPAPPADSTKLPTGDWTIALSSDSPDGWTEPSKVEKPVPVPQPGPPVSTVASAEPLDSKPDMDRPADESGPKVQIDPTLIQPLTPMPGDDNSFTPMPAEALTVPGGPAYPQQHPIVPLGPPPGPQPSAFPTPMPPHPAFAMDPSQSAAVAFAPQPTSTGVRPLDTRGSAPHLPVPSKRRRVLVIALSALLVVAIGVIALIALGGDKPATPSPAASGSGSAVGSTAPPVGSAGSATTVGSAGTAGAAIAVGSAKPVEAAASKICKLEVTTVPDGAELVVDKKVVGTSNGTIELPCNVETKLVVRKPNFVSQTKPITPDGKPLKLALSKLMFTVKISSKPPGATVTSNGKSLGVTPTITKLPAFEAATLVFTKDGFVKATQKLTPKTNNQALQVTLQKKGRR